MQIRDALKGSGIEHADAEVLLARILGGDRSTLLAHPKEELTDEQSKQFSEWVSRRKKHEPVAYIIGEKSFYGRSFTVDSRVLIPRPSTEGLVDLALDFIQSGNEEVRDVDQGIIALSIAQGNVTEAKTIVDIGVGTGCIAITLACERPDLRIIATDIHKDILDLARENAKRHDIEDRIEFRLGEGLDPIADLKEPFIIVSNPPYIPEGTRLMPDVMDYEPHDALFAGEKGLDVILPLLEASRAHSHCRGIVLECRKDQREALRTGA